MRSKCICLVETWIEPDHTTTTYFEEKEFYHANKGRGKGCCAFLPKDANFIKSVVEESFQLLSFCYKTNYQIVLLYISQYPDLNSIRTTIKETLLPDLSPIVIGDFNQIDTKINILTRYFKEAKLVQIVDEPTHQEGRLIDHCYVPLALKDNFDVQIMFKYYSDHAGIQIKF